MAQQNSGAAIVERGIRSGRRPRGLLLGVRITRAGLEAGVAAPIGLDLVTPPALPRLQTILAEQWTRVMSWGRGKRR